MPSPTPPSLDGIWWCEFHPHSSNERWVQRRDDMLAMRNSSYPGHYGLTRFVQDIEYLIAWRDLVPVEARYWRNFEDELRLRPSLRWN